MNDRDVDSVELACRSVENDRLAALADVALAHGTLSEATEAIRTRTMFGGSSDAGTVWASPAGLRVRTGQPGSGEVAVTWRQVAEVLTPVLRGDLGLDLLAARQDEMTARAAGTAAAVTAAVCGWRHAKAAVLDAAVASATVQPSLFDDASPLQRRPIRAGRSR